MTRDSSARSALVTGSTSGIGAEIARQLAGRGTRVLVTGRDEERGRAVVQELTENGGWAYYLPADLAAPPEKVRDLARRAVAVLSDGIDILVNNAAIYPAGPTHELDDTTLEEVLAVNVRAPHLLVAQLAPPMTARGRGAIINIGSWTARAGIPDTSLYGASKAALEQLTRAWTAEYGPHGVCVNTVAPGLVPTPGTAGSRAVMDQMAATTPLGVPVDAEAVAHVVTFLALDAAPSLTGATIDIDGGLTATRLS